ncbi:hypothetical protein ASG40_11515 [Methylobacterium sp. Leaf399]|uniref:hypothetical protein n=1 Tax=Methylobacterium sp. Leaf399 TaxID=1736364 RepID=UPI0006FE2124|nr:hypothetical protein [Methylobacterium sp. Leaf399]KQT08502.1 hypothetical protein ASG40_11515 [Methylobacterium sp. Leaf399]
MTGLSLQPAYGLPTRFIVRDGVIVGYLYAPSAGDGYEVWPSYRQATPMLDVGPATFASFATEVEALAFLGIETQPESIAA